MDLELIMTEPRLKHWFLEVPLNIYGWYYIIETGEVYNYDKNDRVFKKIE